jgi:hypothetical protein
MNADCIIKEDEMNCVKAEWAHNMDRRNEIAIFMMAKLLGKKLCH